MSLVDKAKKLKDEQAERIRFLESQLEEQQERFERLAKSKFKMPAAASKPRKEGNHHVRILIPDTHGCLVEPTAWAAFLRDIQSLSASVREIIWLGDHLECGGFLAQHHVLGYVAQTEYTFEDDVAAANHALDQIATVCPHASQDYLEGNHELRIEKFCVNAAVKNGIDAEFLRKQIGPQSVLHLGKRNVQFIRNGTCYDGLRVPGAIKRGKCHFLHGARHGRNAIAETLADFGANVVMAHIHTAGQASSQTVESGEIVGWCPGCLCQRQPLYKHSQITRWTNGYGLQLVQGDGSFLHINVPIIDGKSYLLQLTERLA